MKAYFKVIILSLKIYENIKIQLFIDCCFIVLLTVYANNLKRSFIDVKNNEVLLNL